MSACEPESFPFVTLTFPSHEVSVAVFHPSSFADIWVGKCDFKKTDHSLSQQAVGGLYVCTIRCFIILNGFTCFGAPNVFMYYKKKCLCMNREQSYTEVLHP